MYLRGTEPEGVPSILYFRGAAISGWTWKPQLVLKESGKQKDVIRF